VPSGLYSPPSGSDTVYRCDLAKSAIPLLASPLRRYPGNPQVTCRDSTCDPTRVQYLAGSIMGDISRLDVPRAARFGGPEHNFQKTIHCHHAFSLPFPFAGRGEGRGFGQAKNSKAEIDALRRATSEAAGRWKLEPDEQRNLLGYKPRHHGPEPMVAIPVRS